MGTLPGLPEPSLPYINQLRTAKATEHADPAPAQPSHSISSNSPGKSRRLRKDSLENLDADPWASPAAAKSQTNPVQNDATPGADAITAMKPARSAMAEPARTTSTFTTTTESPTLNNSLSESNGGLGSGPEAGAGWGNYGTSGIAQGGLGSGGFGSSGEEEGNPPGGHLGRSLGGGRVNNRAGEEMVTVTLLPEKEGIFMFQHHNYEVKSVRRGSAVVRRYSDFVWLLDCLHKRYPFRQLPLLPPKRVAGESPFHLRSRLMADASTVNGRHLSADTSFIEKRRRGLVRFVNALVRHPVLGQEQLVVMFLTVPTVRYVHSMYVSAKAHD